MMGAMVTLRRPRPRSVSAALALLMVGLTGWAAAGAVPGGVRDEPTLPTLPPTDERFPALFDDRGCRRVDVGEVDCSATSEDLDAALAGSEDRRQLEGFVGPHFTTDVGSDQVVVLAGTVTESTAGPWTGTSSTGACSPPDEPATCSRSAVASSSRPTPAWRCCAVRP